MKDRSRANRGRSFEEFVKYANDRYKWHGEGFITKVPTEFIPIRSAGGRICNVKVEHQATVDFIGHYKGHPLAVECKNTNQGAIRWDAVQPNQYADMNEFCKQPGTIGLVLVSFNLQHFYAIPWTFWKEAYDLRVRDDNRATQRSVKAYGQEWTIPKKKSARMEELNPLWEVPASSARYGLDYLQNAEHYWY